MFKYKKILSTTLTLITLNAVLFYTSKVAAQSSNSQVILGSEKSRPKTTLEIKPRCNNFWECLNLNSAALPLLRILSPATPSPIKPKPKCKNSAWACPILSPQGNTNVSEGIVGNKKRRTSEIRLMQEPECKENVWECLILRPLDDVSSSQD
ncbi:hypothetical protein DSM106972_049030 [Dulcicalothrix desertica PCC 7102]|uniref:Uncharacterized protein n=1 Tax=Dulcicalothrix desertica PCC 7102 TaxID=232991 RepID=A0A3S1IXE9_9CYAN|nr:hypothetical protein [Dulcicalothrix desertica]RUT03989.1 hypothetical protein DSM106972_049030 [Dulcicalothrix desertica PCC 7102]TWH43605.1 hypothetical protein CAL7102_07342 [Dulcicalothrix desertica PCC 7102]